MTVPVETIISGEGTGVNLHNNHTLVYCALPENLALSGNQNYSVFLGISHEHRNNTLLKFYLFFLLLIGFLNHLQVLIKNSEG